MIQFLVFLKMISTVSNHTNIYEPRSLVYQENKMRNIEVDRAAKIKFFHCFKTSYKLLQNAGPFEKKK